MKETIRRWMNTIAPPQEAAALFHVFRSIGDRISTQTFTSAALVITSAGGTTAKSGASSIYSSVQGTLVKLSAATPMPALSGVVTNLTWNVFCFFQDNAGALTVAMGTAGASLAAVVFPPLPDGKTLFGTIIIHPTGTGDFTGGTTALDDGTVVPTAVYINHIGAFDPTVITG